MKQKLSCIIVAMLCICIMLSCVPFASAGDESITDEPPDTSSYSYYVPNPYPTKLNTIIYLVVGLDINGTTANCYGDCMGAFDTHDMDLTLTLEKYVGFGEWGYYTSWYLRGKAIPGVTMSKYAYNLPVGSYRVFGDTYTYSGTMTMERLWGWSNIKRVDPPKPN